jgi:predicted small lipoprotein YifL
MKRPILVPGILTVFALAACGPPVPVLDFPPPEADPVPEEGPERQTRPRMETSAERPPVDTAFAAPSPRAALIPADDRFAALVLQPVVLTYDVTFDGTAIGTSTVRLARAEDAWMATQEIRTGPAVQRAEVRFTERMAPLGLTQRLEGGGLPMGTELHVAGGRVLGTATSPEAGAERPVDAPLAAEAVLSGMERWLLAGADLQPGRRFTVPVFEPQRGTPMDVTFHVVGVEEITVPAGTFSAYRVEVSGTPQPAILFVRVERPHVILRQEIPGQPILFELRSVQ